jgi:gentisate 1,2-dioxygenase
MAVSDTKTGSNRTAELEHIIAQLEGMNVEAADKNLWIRTKWNSVHQTPWHLGSSVVPPQLPQNLPVEHAAALPCVWKWSDIEPYLYKLAELCPLELTERQSVLLVNPGFGTKGMKVTNTMRIAISIYKPGNEASAHLHTPNASRTLLSEIGGHTIVEGERIEPKRGDIVFTPNGTWHEHGNQDNQPVIWADLLDWPLLDFLSATWVRNDAENATKYKKPDLSFSERFYGHGGIRPLFSVHTRGEGRNVTPMFHIKGSDIIATLKDLSRYDGDLHEGIIVELVDPMTGESAFPTMSHRAQLLRPGETTLPFRHTASTVYCVMDGSGQTDVDGKILEWEKNDFFVVPNNRWRQHINKGPKPAVLYSYTDQPLLSKIGLYRAQCKSANGWTADIRQ